MTLNTYLPASGTECENYKHAPPRPVCTVLGIKLKAPCVLDQLSIHEHSPLRKSWPFRNDKEKRTTSAKTWRRDVSLETACGSFLNYSFGLKNFGDKKLPLNFIFNDIWVQYPERKAWFRPPLCEGGPSHVSETRDGAVFCLFSLLISWKTLSFWLRLSRVKGRSSPCEVVSWFLFWT